MVINASIKHGQVINVIQNARMQSKKILKMMKI